VGGTEENPTQPYGCAVLFVCFGLAKASYSFFYILDYAAFRRHDPEAGGTEANPGQRDALTRVFIPFEIFRQA